MEDMGNNLFVKLPSLGIFDDRTLWVLDDRIRGGLAIDTMMSLLDFGGGEMTSRRWDIGGRDECRMLETRRRWSRE